MLAVYDEVVVERSEGVLFLQSDGFSGKNGTFMAAQRHRRSVVLGHVYAFAGVQWETSLEGSIFGLNYGCLIDPTAVAFAYTRHLAQRPRLGCGVLLDGVPHFEPLRR